MKFSSVKQQYKFIALSLISISFLVLQGCGSKKGITLDSEPQGANVIADGKKIGVTPMHIKQDDVFPPHWYGATYMVKGTLEMSMDGCEGFSMKVNDAVLMNDIKANLKCNPGMTKPAAKEAKPAAVNTMKTAPAAKTAEPAMPVKAAEPAEPEKASTTKASSPEPVDASIEQRLAKLKNLRDKGVITAEEYSVQRKRILDSL